MRTEGELVHNENAYIIILKSRGQKTSLNSLGFLAQEF